jgi:hypothetical protein
MPALNFQKQFADKVQNGEKNQTIRAYRKRPFEIGDHIYVYTGMRTKGCRKLKEAELSEVQHIVIMEDERIFLESDLLGPITSDKLAKDDGFSSLLEMIQWFKKTHGLPFEGQLIKWE